MPKKAKPMTKREQNAKRYGDLVREVIRTNESVIEHQRDGNLDRAQRCAESRRSLLFDLAYAAQDACGERATEFAQRCLKLARTATGLEAIELPKPPVPPFYLFLP